MGVVAGDLAQSPVSSCVQPGLLGVAVRWLPGIDPFPRETFEEPADRRPLPPGLPLERGLSLG
jgi:hypothetical protein